MEKLKLGVIFGGMSTENEVSCVSGVSVIKNLNKEKYDISPIYIDKNGNWFEVQNIEENEKKGKELEDLFALEQEVNICKIDINSFNDDIMFTTGQMEAIMFMIE